MKKDKSKEAVLIISALIAIAFFINGGRSALDQTLGSFSSVAPSNRDVNPSSQPIAPTRVVVKKGHITLTDQWSEVIDLRNGHGLYGIATTQLSGFGMPIKIRDADYTNDVREVAAGENF